MEHLLLESDADYRWREAPSHEWNDQVDPKFDGFCRRGVMMLGAYSYYPPKLRTEHNCRKLTGRMGQPP